MERFSMALSLGGSRVLYCENPISRIKNRKLRPETIAQNILRFWPAIWGHRLNRFPALARGQSHMAARQIWDAAKEMGLQRPLFVYPYLGRMLPLASAMKDQGCSLIHVCMDYPEGDFEEHYSLADLTMVIPSAGFQVARTAVGNRAIHLPQMGPPTMNGNRPHAEVVEPEILRAIPRPRLTYLGIPQKRLAFSLLRDVLIARPDWHFVYFGPANYLQLPNAHALPWMPFKEITNIAAASDVGFMPYDCSDARQYNSEPLKLLDHFTLGMPVVSTPIASLLALSDVAYLGNTRDELIRAIEEALQETPESAKRIRRMEIAEEHSLQNTAAFLSKVLLVKE